MKPHTKMQLETLRDNAKSPDVSRLCSILLADGAAAPPAAAQSDSPAPAPSKKSKNK